MQKFLIVLGVILIILGIMWPLLKKLNIGHLPGDIYIKNDNFSFYLPITTCIIISIIISVIVWIINKF